MLSISFYSSDGQSSHSIRVVDELYEWLARSEFARVGHAQLIPLEIDGETAELPLVPLAADTRSRLIEFFSESIFQEARLMVSDLDQVAPPPELAIKTYRLKKFLELLDCLKSSVYHYLQRE